jgi:phosphate transport system substrate-binding protein
MRLSRILALGALAALAGPALRADDPAAARAVSAFPPYRPEQIVSGTIRLWGHGSFQRPFLRRLVTGWEQGFRRYHPGARIEYDMYGTSSAIAALYTGVGDLAVLGEELDPGDARLFRQFTGHALQSIPVATGSVAVRNADYAQMFFVHRDNPLNRVTLAQLDGIFGEEHRRGGRNLRTWGDLGLTGAWAARPIHPYGWAIDDSFGLYLERALLGGSHRWNNDLREFRHITRPDGSIYDHGRQILDALARDPDGIAVSNIGYAGPEVKPLALAAREGGPYVRVSAATLIDETYPLTRLIPACFPRAPGAPLDPRVKEFLRYILSREGQAEIARDGSYLPLRPDLAAAAIRSLE